MKTIMTASIISLFAISVNAQNSISNSRWNAHTNIPRSADIQLVFKKDSFLILNQVDKQIREVMIYSLNGDSLHLKKISGTTPCQSESEGWYKIIWSANGEEYSFQTINDPCPQRENFFTHLKFAGRSRENNTSSNSSANPQDRFYKGAKDSTAGINLYRAYELLKGRKSQTVIVAVVGGAFDRSHEDLKDVLWTNEKEIADNGIDDDKNGYVDDTWGWNFLSDKQGNTVTRLQQDVTQIYKLWKDKYDKADRAKLKPNEKEEYDIFQKAKKEWAEYYQYVPAYKIIRDDSAGFFKALKNIAEHTSYERMPWATFIAYNPGSDKLTWATHKAMQGRYFPPRDSIFLRNFIQNFPRRWRGFMNYIDQFLDFYDLDYDPTKIIGDDPANAHERNYGSPYLIKIPLITFNHDTHIAGIIGAKRNNGIGIDGIADNVKIMMVKAMAGGDERDKDIANSIRYAVDNGAKVINMSWGKNYSSHKQVVDEAVRYAEAHDVLLVHAAGNDGQNCDSIDVYPQTKFKDGKLAVNMLQVGCCNTTLDPHLSVWYSNYGKNTVDLFAPGDESFGPLPNNQYGYAGGTSNATPFVVGVAALLKSYFPELTMVQIKNIILESVYKPDIKVIRPHYVDPALTPARIEVLQNEGELVPFSSLSKTGGILDAEAAVRKAIELTKRN